MTKDKMYFYESFADQFDDRMDRYEVEKRLRIIFRDLLSPSELESKRLLDAGCGTGLFSQSAARFGAEVTSMDVGPTLLQQVARKCDSKRVVASVLDLPFASESFDVVISTEVIEHTPNPRRAVAELARVVYPGGTLIVTVPCRTWKWSVHVANALKLRPYEGYENWVGYLELRHWVREAGLSIDRYFGFNLLPFQWAPARPAIDFMDRFGRHLAPFMINLAVRARK